MSIKITIYIQHVTILFLVLHKISTQHFIKKLSLLLVLIVLTLKASAQFTLTPLGFVNSEDSSKEYVVYEFENMNQADLYKQVLGFIHATYKSPKDVLNEIPGEILTIKGIQPDIIGFRKKLGFYDKVFDLDYTVSVKFKENKIRIDIVHFECYIDSRGTKTTLSLTEKGGFLSNKYRIYNPENGKLEDTHSKNALEKFFNDLCNRINASITSKKENEDW